MPTTANEKPETKIIKGYKIILVPVMIVATVKARAANPTPETSWARARSAASGWRECFQALRIPKASEVNEVTPSTEIIM